MSLTITDIRDAKIQWKDFVFDRCVKEFSMKEWAKVATYEYAWRNGAEHERVLSHRVFTLSWEFIPWVTPWTTPWRLVKALRLTNDNKPWVFTFNTIGNFRCIMSNLTITQSPENYTIYDTVNNKQVLVPAYSFQVELLEHTPPNAKTLKEKNDELYPKSEVKPPSDLYSSSLIYKNCTELYNAIMDWKIAPWVNPVINSEWLRYDYDMRKCAYDKWKEWGFKTNSNTDTVSNSKASISSKNTNQKYHIVKAWETWMRIAKIYWVPFTKLFEVNRGMKVRENNYLNDWLYWKTTTLLQAWDKLVIPDWFKQPTKKKTLNRINKPTPPKTTPISYSNNPPRVNIPYQN